MECKLDRLSERTGNFYFEYWNYTYNRPTGINAEDRHTLYCHTFKKGGEWCFIINTRQRFINTVARCLIYNKVKEYLNTYDIAGKVVGDKAFIIDRETFL